MAGSTKNQKPARQYIQPELAGDLRTLIATQAPKAPVFSLPHETNLARMFRDDLATARRAWLTAAKHDPDERLRREQSDFLVATNHEGELVDFHCLRHTCGAWLAMTGAHPKTIQTVMRHSTITLTMDTYGHLFPGQEVEAVSKVWEMLAPTQPQDMQATGTDDDINLAERAYSGIDSGQDAERCIEGATPCNEQPQAPAQKKSPKSLQIADLGNSVQPDATLFPSSGGGTRTPDTRNMIPHVTPKNPEEYGNSQSRAAHSAADEHGEGPIDTDLRDVIQRWADQDA